MGWANWNWTQQTHNIYILQNSLCEMVQQTLISYWSSL